MNTPIPKFCDGNKVNVTAAELQLTKMRSASFYKKNNLLSEAMPTDVNKVLKTKC